MKREDIQKLLGGYATGTLTAEEQQALFAAALEDQELFDAIGREQALRDLLRDPAAKAELLAVLDTAERGGFWAWMRRPLVASLATAAVAAIAVVTVWQGARVRPPAAAPSMLAEMKAPDSKAIRPKALDSKATEPKADGGAAGVPAKRQAQLTSRRAASAIETADSPASPGTQTMLADASKKEFAAAAPAPPPPPAAAPVPSRPGIDGQPVSAAETVQVQAASAGTLSTPAEKLTVDSLTLDARSLFYANSFAPRKDGLLGGAAGGGGTAVGAATAGEALGTRRAEADAGGPARGAAGTGGAAAPAGVAAPPTRPRFAAQQVRTASGNLAKTTASTLSTPGVRVSILRGDREAAVTTVLDPGERVRLKLTPNEDGFLYVAARDGNVWTMVAQGPAQRLIPFETPPLPYAGSGQKLVYVMLSRQAQTVSPQALAGLVGANLVETVADPDLATYIVAGLQNGAPQQVVQPITLTYR